MIQNTTFCPIDEHPFHMPTASSGELPNFEDLAADPVYGQIVSRITERAFDLAAKHYPVLIKRLPHALRVAECEDYSRVQMGRILAHGLAIMWARKHGLPGWVPLREDEADPIFIRRHRNFHLLFMLIWHTARLRELGHGRGGSVEERTREFIERSNAAVSYEDVRRWYPHVRTVMRSDPAWTVDVTVHYAIAAAVMEQSIGEVETATAIANFDNFECEHSRRLNLLGNALYFGKLQEVL